jgi:hypothetical protein
MRLFGQFRRLFWQLKFGSDAGQNRRGVLTFSTGNGFLGRVDPSGFASGGERPIDVDAAYNRHASAVCAVGTYALLGGASDEVVWMRCWVVGD